MRRAFLTLLLCLVISVTLAGHDFWLAAATWHASPGAKVTVTANVGGRFPVPTSFTTPDRVASLTLIGPTGRTELAGLRREGSSLAADLGLPSDPATYLVVMVIKPRFIEIPPNDFRTYLTHEGLGRVLAERERLGETSKPGRERYSRYAKLLIHVGDGANEHVTRPVGLPAELVPLTDPTRLRVGDTLAVQLLFEGRPVAGALVGGIYGSSKGAPDEWPLKASTDERGEARLRLTDPGPWLIRTVHMVRRDNETGAQAADWESYWASLTFDLAK